MTAAPTAAPDSSHPPEGSASEASLPAPSTSPTSYSTLPSDSPNSIGNVPLPKPPALAAPTITTARAPATTIAPAPAARIVDARNAAENVAAPDVTPATSVTPPPPLPLADAVSTTSTTAPAMSPVTPATSPPADVIHSASPDAAFAQAASLSAQEPVRTPRRKFSIFSPRQALSPRSSSQPAASLRRMFTPAAARAADAAAAAAAVAGDADAPAPDKQDATCVPPPLLPPSIPPPPPPSAEVAAPDASLVAPVQQHGGQAATRARRPRLHRMMQAMCACFPPRRPLGHGLSDLEYGNHLRTLKPTYEPDFPLLPSAPSHVADRICLVLDLDETLVHSSFTPIPGADFEIPLEMQGEVHTVYVKKRPGVDHFLEQASKWFEIVIFTASLALYANPVMDLLDPSNLVKLRLYREHCVLLGGCYVKDIAKLGRDLKRTFIIDNSPLSYILQPENAIPITAFFTDDNDDELERMLSLLEQARDLRDVRRAFS